MSAREDMPLLDVCRGFCENAPHAMLIADAGGEIVWANAAAARILGKESPADLFQKQITSLLFSRSINSWDDLSSLTQKTGTFSYSVLPLGGMDAGATLDVMISHAAEAEKEWYYIYITSVPGKMNTISSTRHDGERLNLILQCADLGVWDVILSSGEVVVDGRWAKMVGYRLDELLPLTAEGFIEYVHPDDRDVCLSLFSAWSKGKNPTGSYGMRLRHKDATWVWISSQWQVFQSPEEEPELRVVGVHQDITDMVKKDEAIHEAQKKIRS
ncbi:PAS domain-containing protein, partial [Methanogenium sp. MK-MG]|uniref:PAS domain-containing protein n=1 Tax=Methanogenium sp. MK-MG TaxID=2599926 RepID=UPI0013E9B5A3